MFSLRPIVPFLICLQFFPHLNAQIDSCGLYLSTIDYVNHKLTKATNCKSEKPSIKALEFWNSSKSILVRYRGAKYKYVKTGIFGFRDCDNHDYRFFIDTPYEIINRQYFVLYRLAHMSASFDFVHPEFTYFFSKSPGSRIYPLSKPYLKWVYRKNKVFAALLDSAFQTNDELSKYPLIQIYEESLLGHGQRP